MTEALIREGEKAAQECNSQAVRAAAQKLSGIGVICGLNANAEADRLNGLTKLIDSYEQNIRAASDAVKAATDQCDLRAAEVAMTEVNRLAEGVAYRCRQVSNSISQMVMESFDRVQALKSQLASLEANVKAVGAAVKAATDNCDLRAAEVAMAEVNRLVAASARSSSSAAAREQARRYERSAAAEKRRPSAAQRERRRALQSPCWRKDRKQK